MDIVEFLKSELGARVSCGHRWLVWEPAMGVWIVYERLPYQKKTRELIYTKSQIHAIEMLAWKDDEE